MKPAVFYLDISNGFAPFYTRMRKSDVATHFLQSGDQAGT